VKLNPVRETLAGRSIALIDDSLVRGTTSQKIVQMCRDAGAKEVHLRISCPPTIGPCYYGIDTPRREELIASRLSVEETRRFVGADSLGYLSLDGMMSAIGGEADDYCTACWTDRHPVPLPIENEGQRKLFEKVRR
jgi:amidophosphoribosyltransferase